MSAAHSPRTAGSTRRRRRHADRVIAATAETPATTRSTTVDAGARRRGESPALPQSSGVRLFLRERFQARAHSLAFRRNPLLQANLLGFQRRDAVEDRFRPRLPLLVVVVVDGHAPTLAQPFKEDENPTPDGGWSF
jgi:hypothetical protein